jgi:hypothetical protein
MHADVYKLNAKFKFFLLIKFKVFYYKAVSDRLENKKFEPERFVWEVFQKSYTRSK